ncbi:MAG: 50S ribosomal protein L5 [Candidatus Pacearchaeota archaeon]
MDKNMREKLKEEKKNESNKIREVMIEKVILSCGGVKENLEKSMKLLKKISKRTPVKRKTVRRIPNFEIRPKMEVGCMVTIRGKEAINLLERLLAAIDKKLKRKQIAENHFSFGIEEYIEIPGEEYDREIGMLGLNVTVVFSRKGKRVKMRQRKCNKIPIKQNVSREEIIKFVEEKFKVEVN